MIEIIDTIKKYREERRQAEEELERRREEVTREAHEAMAHMENHDEFVEALNFMYWEMPELQVAPVQCSTGLRQGDFRSYIKPRSTGQGCAIEHCNLEIYVTARTNLRKYISETVLCPQHYNEWWNGLYRDIWPIYHPYRPNTGRYPKAYPNALWMPKGTSA